VLTQKQREIRRKYQADMMRKQMQNMPKPTPEMMREIVMMGPDMVKKLGVTPDQLKRIDPIAQRAYKEFEKMMMNSGNNLDQQAMMKRLEGLADKAIADVRKVLNPRQQKMYDEVVAQRRKQFADAQRRMQQSPR
jgi:hypothetical protein